jgi:hypothetical protein
MKSTIFGQFCRQGTRFNSPVRQQKLVAALCVSAAALLVLGAKFWLIRANGSVTPFWDQWDEAGSVFEPYLNGQLTLLHHLLAAHNEHRIFFTRLLDLLLLELAGHWDPILQMLINAVVHVVFIVILLLALGRMVRDLGYFSLCLWAGVVSAIPFSWENTLAGFQSQFYFLLIFSTVALILLIPAPALSGRWWIGSGAALASILCLSSGALTLVPPIVLRLIQLALSLRSGWREWIGLGLQAGATIALAMTVPTVAQHAPLKAHSIDQFASALWTIAGWPFPLHWWSPVLVFLPLLILAGLACGKRAAADDPVWFGLGLGVWLGVQFASLAYGRAVGTTSPRYLDIAVVGLVVNFAALFWLVRTSLTTKAYQRATNLLACVWVIIVAYSLVGVALATLPQEVANKRETGQIETDNVRAFVKSGDASVLRDKPVLHIPYPDPERLANFLQNETIRSILSTQLTGDVSEPPDVHNKLLLRGRLGRYFELLRRSLLQSPALLLALSFALFACVIPTVALERLFLPRATDDIPSAEGVRHTRDDLVV